MEEVITDLNDGVDLNCENVDKEQHTIQNLSSDENKEKKALSRIVFLDVLRFVAIFFVLYNHRLTYDYNQWITSFGVKFLFYSTWSLLCKTACPLFFMISGAVLLKKEEGFLKLFLHRILRILIIMLLGAIWQMRNDFSFNSFVNFFLLEANWYLYAYLAFLLMIPFLRCMVKVMNKKLFLYFFILSAILYTLPSVFDLGISSYMIIFTNTFSWPSMCWHVLFPIIGYFLNNLEDLGFDKKERKIFYFVLIGVLVIELVMAYYKIYTNLNTSIEVINQRFAFLPACLIFIGVKSLTPLLNKLPKVILKVISIVSLASFGTYLIDVYTDFNIKFVNFIFRTFPNVLGFFGTNILAIFLVLIANTIIITLLRLIPYVKKVL